METNEVYILKKGYKLYALLIVLVHLYIIWYTLSYLLFEPEHANWSIQWIMVPFFLGVIRLKFIHTLSDEEAEKYNESALYEASKLEKYVVYHNYLFYFITMLNVFIFIFYIVICFASLAFFHFDIMYIFIGYVMLFTYVISFLGYACRIKVDLEREKRHTYGRKDDLLI